MQRTQGGWKQLLGDNCIMIDDYKTVPTTIARIIAEGENVKDIDIKDSIQEIVEKEQEIIL